MPQDHIRPYGERNAVYSEAKRRQVRLRLLGVNNFVIGNSLYDLINKEYLSRKFYTIERTPGLENSFDVMDQISSKEYDGVDVENPLFDYWNFRINEKGKIVSPIFSSYLNETFFWKVLQH